MIIITVDQAEGFNKQPHFLLYVILKSLSPCEQKLTYKISSIIKEKYPFWLFTRVVQTSKILLIFKVLCKNQYLILYNIVDYFV